MTPKEATSVIAVLDTALGLAREHWLRETDPRKKADYKGKLDGLLDERLAHMAVRDGKAHSVPIKVVAAAKPPLEPPTPPKVTAKKAPRPPTFNP